ncbi:MULTISPECIES: hypothetical protein [unclassified Duganella]|uniref:head-tail joining protein n=1 Tax=unclassified Duganella TaxID=2636909 RepID=UPI000882CAE0|nr:MULTISPECIES: hypothetical protein [unclassified Duganella]SDH40940.1 hypothetical protein SAMN05216320_1136 [Duganella sp. OV458]SDK61208.1 hypothetical protein SAMN05428973_113157 [Duganella sp. OV510]
MFDALEARVNQAAMKKLANALAVIGDAVDVPVIFDAEYKVGAVGVVGMGASAPQLVIADADVPADFLDMQITVNGVDWVVADRHPDFTKIAGLSTVILEKR